MKSKFRIIDRSIRINIDPDFKSVLPEDSLARFIMDIVEQLDTSEIEDNYSGYGNKAYPPKMMLALLFYCYINGIFSSRKIEKSIDELIPVMYITHGNKPDHTVIARFRKQFGIQMHSIFTQILGIAATMGILKLGDVALAGTKINANASKHKALSYEYTLKLSKQIEDEVALLIKAAEDADSKDFDELNIPDEIKKRQDRLAVIKAAKAEIEERRKKKYEEEKDEYDAKMAERAAKEKARGRKLGGKKPTEPTPEPKATDQVNLTDGESRIMPTSGGGFSQAYNAQASVDMDSRIIVHNHVTQNTNDKNELSPSLSQLEALPEPIGKVKKVASDSGYDSQKNREDALNRGIDLHLPKGREKHNNFLNNFIENKEETEEQKQRREIYNRRKSTIEPVFGVIKSVIGFTRFSLRGLENVSNEWSLVCIAYNLKRLCAQKMKIA
jgi:transposase/IS5 family transposase